MKLSDLILRSEGDIRPSWDIFLVQPALIVNFPNHSPVNVVYSPLSELPLAVLPPSDSLVVDPRGYAVPEDVLR